MPHSGLSATRVGDLVLRLGAAILSPAPWRPHAAFAAFGQHPHFSHGLIPFIKYGQPALLALLALRMLKNKLSKA